MCASGLAEEPVEGVGPPAGGCAPESMVAGGVASNGGAAETVGDAAEEDGEAATLGTVAGPGSLRGAGSDELSPELSLCEFLVEIGAGAVDAGEAKFSAALFSPELLAGAGNVDWTSGAFSATDKGAAAGMLPDGFTVWTVVTGLSVSGRKCDTDNNPGTATLAAKEEVAMNSRGAASFVGSLAGASGRVFVTSAFGPAAERFGEAATEATYGESGETGSAAACRTERVGAD